MEDTFPTGRWTLKSFHWSFGQKCTYFVYIIHVRNNYRLWNIISIGKVCHGIWQHGTGRAAGAAARLAHFSNAFFPRRFYRFFPRRSQNWLLRFQPFYYSICVLPDIYWCRTASDICCSIVRALLHQKCSILYAVSIFSRIHMHL